jgi:ribosomal protein L31E
MEEKRRKIVVIAEADSEPMKIFIRAVSKSATTEDARSACDTIYEFLTNEHFRQEDIEIIINDEEEENGKY